MSAAISILTLASCANMEDMVRKAWREIRRTVALADLPSGRIHNHDHALTCRVRDDLCGAWPYEETTAVLGIVGFDAGDVGKIRSAAAPSAEEYPPDAAPEYELLTHVTSIADRRRGRLGNEMILQIVRRHHERLDGSGYPGRPAR